MDPAEIDLRAFDRGAVTAPAGCGKTELIARTLAAYRERKPVLLLTHTNAGVAALRSRLTRAGVPVGAYKLSTIDGWAMRLISTFPRRSAHDPAILGVGLQASNYPAIRDAAWQLLQAGHINDVVQATYSRLIVDEYQDCSQPQHYLVQFLSGILPTCVVGDPLQAIFGFGDNVLVDWHTQVCAHFPIVGELRTPWRWRNVGAESLGQWLLEVRRQLEAGQRIDLRSGPTQHVTWIPASAADHAARLQAARTVAPTADGRVLLIASSRNRTSQQNFASQTPGASTVESVELTDLIRFGHTFDVTAANAIEQLLALGQSVMTHLGVPDFLRRLEILRRGTNRTPPNDAERHALAFQAAPTHAAAATLLSDLRGLPDVRVYRPAILYGALKALRAAGPGVAALAEATKRVREENRLAGRPLPRRAVGSTLLLKGLEAEVAVILDSQGMNAANLYVALTRGSMQLVVCHPTPTLLSP